MEDKIAELAKWIRDIYLSDGGSSGCCLHVVTDEGLTYIDKCKACQQKNRVNVNVDRLNPKCGKCGFLLITNKTPPKRPPPSITPDPIKYSRPPSFWSKFKSFLKGF